MDYEKKYKEALERAKNIYGASVSKDILSTLTTIFPELKESEDEKIRKAAIEFVKQNNSFNYNLGISKEQVLAWLEKQVEQKVWENVEPVTEDDKLHLIMDEQKTTWSEEDEGMCQETIDWFEKKCFPYALPEENPAKYSIIWLKTLKERMKGENYDTRR